MNDYVCKGPRRAISPRTVAIFTLQFRLISQENVNKCNFFSAIAIILKIEGRGEEKKTRCTDFLKKRNRTPICGAVDRLNAYSNKSLG